MADERILITVRTYPTISAKYTETVCTGGITDAGEWRRLYPVPLRYLDDQARYRTYDIVRLAVRPGQDGRSETRRPDNQTIVVERHLKSPPERHAWVWPTVVPSLQALVSAERSIGAVAVAAVDDFVADPAPSEWSAAEKQKINQLGLFDERQPLAKIPFNFRLIWRDADGGRHDSMFCSWEVCETWRSWERHYDRVIERMRDKWMDDVFSADRKLAMFVGNHARWRQTYMVVGTYGPVERDIYEAPQLF